MIDLALFLQLTASCAPHVAPETLAAVARTESGFNELSVYDNTAKRGIQASSKAEAIALATDAISVQRHSVDLGLMQVNSANLPRLGMTIADAFDACGSLAAADRVLVAGYAAPTNPADPQDALRQALSRYNTGDPARGVANGYVARVQASAEVVVPAIRLRSEPAVAVQPRPVATAVPSPPPSWDVYRLARTSMGSGALVYGGPVSATNNPPRATSLPVQALPRSGPTQQALNDTR